MNLDLPVSTLLEGKLHLLIAFQNIPTFAGPDAVTVNPIPMIKYFFHDSNLIKLIRNTAINL